MSLLNPQNSVIWTVTNPTHEKFLRIPVADFDVASVPRKELEHVITHMRKLMIAEKGVGLSANQIGLSVRLFICQLPNAQGTGYQGKFYAIFNPRLVRTSEKKVCDEEGCLSIPGWYGSVDRFYSITLSGVDKQNRPLSISARGLLARIMQHELDHLNGVLFTDHASNVQRIAEL
ncbi:MAG: peptide deformylase [Patescibacteria group bacterium]|nr:peptide deformylase [Patescibacteria group bacterium]